MAPYVYGSSTMGVKKSTVCTRASSAVSLYTPASSAVSNPISTFSFSTRGRLASTRSKTFGLNLDAQPAAFTWAVSFFADTSTAYDNQSGCPKSPGRNRGLRQILGGVGADHVPPWSVPFYHIRRKTIMPCQRPVPTSENDPRVLLRVPNDDGSVAL